MHIKKPTSNRDARMRLHVRLDLSSSCNQRTRSGCRARFVGYERLEDMNDCRFLHYWKLSISPGRYMYRNGGCERTVHNLQFLPGKSFTASNRSYPAKAQAPGPGARAQAPVPRRARTWHGFGTANPDNKKRGAREFRIPCAPDVRVFLLSPHSAKPAGSIEPDHCNQPDHSGRCDVATAA